MLELLGEERFTTQLANWHVLHGMCYALQRSSAQLSKQIMLYVLLLTGLARWR